MDIGRGMEFVGRIYLDKKDVTKTVWMQSESESSSLPRKYRRNYVEDNSTCHQAAAVCHKQDPVLARQNSSSPPASPPHLGVLSDTEMTDPSSCVWDVHCHHIST